MEKAINFCRRYIELYSTISISNHLIVIMLFILVSNYIVVTLNLSAYFLIFTLGVVFFLSLIRGNMKHYNIEINNNGSVTFYNNVKYKFDKKKDILTIYESNGKSTRITQGNFSITEAPISK